MSDEKYTPGPWRLNTDGCGDLFVSGAGSEYICEIGPYCSGADMADARLIAAAPELLEALMAARSELEAYEEDATGERYNNLMINAAIAKAKGEANA